MNELLLFPPFRPQQTKRGSVRTVSSRRNWCCSGSSCSGKKCGSSQQWCPRRSCRCRDIRRRHRCHIRITDRILARFSSLHGEFQLLCIDHVEGKYLIPEEWHRITDYRYGKKTYLNKKKKWRKTRRLVEGGGCCFPCSSSSWGVTNKPNRPLEYLT